MESIKEDLLDCLKFSYIQYKAYVEMNNSAKAEYMKGYCAALEDTLEVYFHVKTKEIKSTKNEFLGNTPMGRIDIEDFINSSFFPQIVVRKKE